MDTRNLLGKLLQIDYYPPITSDDDIEMVPPSLYDKTPRILLITQKEIDFALKAARTAKPRVIEITDFPDDDIKLGTLGCHGSAGLESKNVAKLINSNAKKNPCFKPNLFSIEGDNIYPDGLYSPNDQRCETQIHEVFGDRTLSEICDVPLLIALGNHDEGRSTKSGYTSKIPYWSNPNRFREAALQEIAHTYLPHRSDNPKLKVSKAELFKQDKIPYHLLPKYNMPHECVSWIIGKVQIFVLNSNTYAKDFLRLLKDFSVSNAKTLEEYLQSDDVDNNNQAAWAYKTYLEAKAKKNDRKIIWSWHNPIVTYGKRDYPNGYDSHHYLTPLEMTQYRDIFTVNKESKNYKEKITNIFKKTHEKLVSNAPHNEILKNILDLEDIHPDIFTVAHDHSSSFISDPSKNFSQVCSGTGGDPEEFQAQHRYENEEKIGCLNQNAGYSLITINKNNPDLIQVDNFSMDGQHLQFQHNSPKPIQKEIKDDRIIKLHTTILNASKIYKIFLQEKLDNNDGFFDSIPRSINGLFNYNGKHSEHDVGIMNNLLNYFKQVEMPEYSKVEKFVHDQIHLIENKHSPDSFYKTINALLTHDFDKITVRRLMK